MSSMSRPEWQQTMLERTSPQGQDRAELHLLLAQKVGRAHRWPHLLPGDSTGEAANSP